MACRSPSLAVALVLIPLAVAPVQAQVGGESNAGYLDPAMPLNLLRLRYDASWNNRSANRAEFGYPAARPRGPGLPRPEPSIDTQDFSVYAENAFAPGLSAFIEAPWRLINPERNANSGGFSDLNAGFKYAFVQCEDLVAAFQFRTYAPTGDGDRGLGTRHVSLEPGLLLWRPLSERLILESELRYWVPVGGSDFAGDVIRYGAGLNYYLFEAGGVRVIPMAELIGWTALSGKVSRVESSGAVTVQDAAGDTILDVKVGARVRFGDAADVYMSYSRPLTGDRWYENQFRVEFRVQY